MIKVDPALWKRKARCQPALVRAGSGTKIDDLQSPAETIAGDQIVDQFGEEAVDGGGPGGGVSGGAGGKPGRIDGGLRGRFR